MNVPNLKRLSVQQLETLRAKIVEAIPQAKAKEVGELRAEIEEKIAEKGFQWSDIFSPSGRPRQKYKANLKPKWANPKNPSEVWSGRGRPPKWFDKETAQAL